MEEKNLKFGVSDGLLIAASSLAGYLFAYVYESGYARVFNIPEEFISLSLTNIFVAFALVWIIPVSFILWGPLVTNILKNVPTPIQKEIKNLTPLIFMSAVALLYYGPNWKKWIYSISFLLCFALWNFGWPLLTQPGKQRYIDKLEADQRVKTELMGSNLFLDHLREYVGLSGLKLIWWIMIAAWVFRISGEATALRQKDFLILKTPTEEKIVLKIYEDKLICADFNRDTKELKEEFTVYRLSEGSKLDFRRETIGPLHVGKKE